MRIRCNLTDSNTTTEGETNEDCSASLMFSSVSFSNGTGTEDEDADADRGKDAATCSPSNKGS